MALLESLELPELDAAVAVHDKAWMLAAKRVDELVEPTMLEMGVQYEWYARGDAAAMADYLYRVGPSALGPAYAQLGEAFVRALREFSEERAFSRRPI